MSHPVSQRKAPGVRQLDLPAIRILQGGGRAVYVFGVDGKDVTSFAAVSRVRSGALGEVLGYQRPEVLSHIAEIQAYLEGEAPILPNAIVLAFDSSVAFTPSLPQSTEALCPGTLHIEWDPDGDATARPAWVVDGQQRLAAIRGADVPAFRVCATAFITDDQDAQREQFLLLNNTRPLPKSLVYELLPGTDALLPAHLARRRFPSHLTRRLNLDAGGPFHGRIQMMTHPQGDVRDNSVMRMLDHSLTDGALFRIKLAHGEGPEGEEAMLRLLRTFWSGVRDTWPEAWALKPRKSRLLHGAGLVSLGFVMDEMADAHRDEATLTVECVRQELEQLREHCFWTAGSWVFGPGQSRRWNEVQNTSKDIDLLSNHLLRLYRIRVRRLMASGPTA